MNLSGKSYQREGQPRKTEFATWHSWLGTVGLGSFIVRIQQVQFLFPFSKFLSLVSFLGLGLVLGSVLGLGLG